MAKFRISLSDMKFYAFIGVMELERIEGNEFLVDIDFMVDDSGFVSEKLESTISYADVFEIAQEAMQRQWLLLESVSQYIAKSIGEKWSNAEDIHVKITKLAPPIKDFNGTASVEYIL